MHWYILIHAHVCKNIHDAHENKRRGDRKIEPRREGEENGKRGVGGSKKYK